MFVGLEFRVLGPLEARRNGEALPLGGPKQRALMALLLLRRNRVISVDELVDALWGELPPPSATKVVQQYISRLRRILADGREDAPQVLETRSPGYLLRVAPGELDLERFEVLVDRARRAEAPDASMLLREALMLWRGAPLADLAFESFAREPIVELEEVRLAALEARIEADLELRRHLDVIGELRTLIDAHPYRERLRAQLMLALYRSGRQAEALTAYREARAALRDDLGLEPSRDLAALERAILRQDASLDEPDEAPAVEAAAPETVRAASAPIAPEEGPAVSPSHEQRPAAIRRRRVQAVALAGTLAAVAVVAAGVILGRGSASAGPRPGPDTVARLDPTTGRVQRIAAVGHGPSALAGDDRRVWAANELDRTLTTVDAATGAVDRTIAIPAPTGLVDGNGGLWISAGFGLPGRSAGGLLELDPTDESVTATVPLGNGVGELAIAQGRVWTVDPNAGSLTPVDPNTGASGRPVPVPSDPETLAVGDGAIWVGDGLRPQVRRVDPGSHRLSPAYILPGVPTALAVGPGALWAATDQDQVVRLDPAGRVITTIPVGEGPEAIVAAAGVVWVAEGRSRRLEEISPSLNRVVRRIPLDGAPSALWIGRGALWVAVR